MRTQKQIQQEIENLKDEIIKTVENGNNTSGRITKLRALEWVLSDV